jgi:hypothetical protein
MARSKVKGIVRSNNTATVLKVGLTAAAFAAATYSNMLGRRIGEAREVQLADDAVSPDVAVAIRRQSVLRWVMPALAGTLMVMGALDRNNRRTTSRVARAIDRFAPDLDRLAPDRIAPALAPALERIGPALERITPDWVDERRMPSLAS